MSKKFLVNLDLNNNSLLNPVLNPLATAPANANPYYVYTSSANNDKGTIYVNIGTYSSPSWLAVGAVQSVNNKTGAVVLTQDDVGDGTTYVRTHNDLTDALATLINGALQKSGGTMSGAIAMGSNKITGLADGTAATDAAAYGQIPTASSTTPKMDGTAAAGTETSWAKGDHVHPSDTSKLSLSGGTMTGDIAMGTHKVTGLGTPTADADAATKAYVDGLLAGADAMIFKGTIGSDGTITSLPNTHNAGWTYKVITAGSYAGKTCEVGDLIICIKDGTAASNDDWTVAQTNIDGAVTGPASATSGHIPTFNGTTGKIIQDGYGVASSITNDSNTIPTTAAVWTAVSGASTLATATGTIGTSATSATVSFSGTLISAFATMGGVEVELDKTIGSSSVVFTTAAAPTSAVTCTVVYY